MCCNSFSRRSVSSRRRWRCRTYDTRSLFWRCSLWSGGTRLPEAPGQDPTPWAWIYTPQTLGMQPQVSPTLPLDGADWKYAGWDAVGVFLSWVHNFSMLAKMYSSGTGGLDAKSHINKNNDFFLLCIRNSFVVLVKNIPIQLEMLPFYRTVLYSYGCCHFTEHYYTARDVAILQNIPIQLEMLPFYRTFLYS